MVPQAQCKPMVDRMVTFKLSLAPGARDRMVQSDVKRLEICGYTI